MKIKRIISVFLIISGLFVILKSDFKFPMFSQSQVLDLLPKEIRSMNLITTAKKDDVIIHVYRKNQEEFYIAEFSKKTLLDLYSLSELVEVRDIEKEYNSVISSSLNEYAYKLDLVNQTIQIFEGKHPISIYYGLFELLTGILLLLYSVINSKLND